jgi:ribosome assembly protein YihI (activator of Der GTPase)
MTLLEIPEKGLSVLENSVNQHRDALTAQLAIGEKMSDKDSAWLDDTAIVLAINTIRKNIF